MLDREDPMRHIAGRPDDLKLADLDTYESYRATFAHIDQVSEVGR